MRSANATKVHRKSVVAKRTCPGVRGEICALPSVLRNGCPLVRIAESTEDPDSLPCSAVTLFDRTRRTRLSVSIAMTKGNHAKYLIPKHLARRRFPLLAKVKTGRRHNERVPPPVEDFPGDISFRVETRTRKHFSKLFPHPPLNIAVGVEINSDRPFAHCLQQILRGS